MNSLLRSGARRRSVDRLREHDFNRRAAIARCKQIVAQWLNRISSPRDEFASLLDSRRMCGSGDAAGLRDVARRGMSGS